MRIPAVSLAAALLPVLSVSAFSPQVVSGQAVAPAHMEPHLVDGIAEICPVSLDMRHGSGLAVAKEANAGDHATPDPDRTYRPPMQRFELNIHNYDLFDIVSIDAVAHVQSSNTGIVPVMPASIGDTEPDEQLPLHLHRLIKANEEIAFPWSIPNLNPIDYVQIKMVTYRDGSTWSRTKAAACRFTPNPLMLVTER